MPFSSVVSCVPISHYSCLILGESNGFCHSLHSSVLNFCWNLMLHSESYNVQDFVLDVTHMMAFWVFTPCDVMYLFWHCGGMSCVCLRDDSLFGVDISLTLKKEAAHSSKTLEQAGCNKQNLKGRVQLLLYVISARCVEWHCFHSYFTNLCIHFIFFTGCIKVKTEIWLWPSVLWLLYQILWKSVISGVERRVNSHTLAQTAQ